MTPDSITHNPHTHRPELPASGHNLLYMYVCHSITVPHCVRLNFKESANAEITVGLRSLEESHSCHNSKLSLPNAVYWKICLVFGSDLPEQSKHCSLLVTQASLLNSCLF